MTIVVKTKTELKRALANNTYNFTVTGKLAEDIKKSKKVAKLGKISLALLTASIAAFMATPITGGLSGAVGAAGFLAASPAIASAGISTSVMFSVVALGGVTIVLALFKDYDVKYSVGPSGLTAEFTRKKR